MAKKNVPRNMRPPFKARARLIAIRECQDVTFQFSYSIGTIFRYNHYKLIRGRAVLTCDTRLGSMNVTANVSLDDVVALKSDLGLVTKLITV